MLIVSKICSRWLQSSLVPWQKIILLSTKKRCDIRGPCEQAATPWIEPVDVACWRRDDSTSTQNKKRKEDMGSPYLKPQKGTMWPRDLPFNLIE